MSYTILCFRFLNACSLANVMKFTDDAVRQEAEKRYTSLLQFSCPSPLQEADSSEENGQERQPSAITQANITVTVSDDGCTVSSAGEHNQRQFVNKL